MGAEEAGSSQHTVMTVYRPLSRLAVNFTAVLTFSRLKSRHSHDFCADSSLAFSLRSCSFVQFLRAKAESFARLCHRLGVCLSVRLSVTLVSCIKTVHARITKSSLWSAPRSLVYRDKISCHWVQGFPSNEGVEEGYPLKKTSFCRYWLE